MNMRYGGSPHTCTNTTIYKSTLPFIHTQSPLSPPPPLSFTPCPPVTHTQSPRSLAQPPPLTHPQVWQHNAMEALANWLAEDPYDLQKELCIPNALGRFVVLFKNKIASRMCV